MTRALVIGTLSVAVIVSALAVVLSRHQARTLFVDLQGLERERDVMNEEWGQLQLEQATWGTHARVEEKAASELKMVPPQPASVIMVSP